MMPMQPFWWDLLVLALSLAGFVLLALANDREGKLLLRRVPGRLPKVVLRVAGYGLLAVALVVCVLGWRGNFGPFLWFGWLTVAVLVWVFAIAYWPWRAMQPERQLRASRSKAQATADVGGVAVPAPTSAALWRRGWHALLVLLLIALPLGFAAAVYQAPVHPLLRTDAVKGQVGPWTFTLSEEEQEPPEDTPSGIPVKHLMLRFCDACDADIRAAWLKLRPPRPPALGERFVGNRWEREATLPIPAGIRPEDQLWLTVVGKEGQTHHVALDVAQVSPALAQFILETSR
ncbi:MAG: DUF3325 domain-containing protein [Rhodocyclaceae bacterium]|nr:DUF3325 domain-containing protein [Rhodocyclaceae bacterium]